ncbi:MAG: hypothetical protein RJA14_1062 [Pseudomonadota bacterium]|jgi:hypothetical protein
MVNATPDPANPEAGADAEERVVFDYIKSPSFRSLHADGLIGGITPTGHLHFALFCERTALPQRHVHKLTSVGALGEQVEEETVSRGGVVREMEVDAFVTLDAAKRMRDWFTARVGELEERNEMIASMMAGQK